MRVHDPQAYREMDVTREPISRILELLSIHSDLCVDAISGVCHQLGLLGIDLHAIGCGGSVETLN